MADGHFEPTRVLRTPGGGFSALAVALVAALGILLGVLIVVLLGGGADAPPARTVVQRVTVPVAVTTPGDAIVTTTVPAVVGEPLDIAKERLERAGFKTDTQGGGTFGVIVDDNWVVVSQSPTATERREVGSLVTLSIERR